MICFNSPDGKWRLKIRNSDGMPLKWFEPKWEDLKKFPGLFLAGSAYRGIGIPDCIQNGNQAAESAFDFLNSKSHVSI